jgi:hypothetical protein
LENVAKDWCMSIRASQVMPVYPLTQDLQPGDVFLTARSIEKEQDLWNGRGFLPLDHHLTRLDPSGYDDFYDFSFCPPESRPSKSAGQAPGVLAAPLSAAFPSYTFSVRRSGSFGAAFPIQGIPIGLGLMKSHAADGAIDIDEGRTLGVDEASLYSDLQAWAVRNRALLRAYEPDGARRVYLRVVTRVYQTSRITVSLYDASNFAGGADVAETRPLSDAIATPPSDGKNGDTGTAAVENYRKALAAVNASLSGTAKPGASLRVTSATARSVSLDETFNPPLAVGYLAFDCEILGGGGLGPPVAALARLNGEIDAAVFGARPVEVQQAVVAKAQYTALKLIAASDADARAAVAGLDALAATLPALEALEVRRDPVSGKREAVRAPLAKAEDYLSVLAFDGAAEETASIAARLLSGELAAASAEAFPGSPEEVRRRIAELSSSWREAQDRLAQRRAAPAAEAAHVYRRLFE